MLARANAITGPTRTSSDTSHRLGELHIRIRSPTECEPISPDTADSHLLDVLRPWANHACEQHYSLDSAPSIECVRDRTRSHYALIAVFSHLCPELFV